MKRRANLYQTIISTENLIDAAYRASKNKRHRPDVIRFNRNLMDNISAIQRELADNSYVSGAYREFHIYDKKLRKISAAPYRDRVVHHALCNVIMPVDNSFANRVAKGTHRAVLLCQRYLRGNTFYIKFDIQKYFASIDHGILKDLVRKKIKCAKTLALVDQIIDNSNEQDGPLHYYPGDDLFTPMLRRKGIPIGNLTSQYFANIYLTPLDYFITQELKIRHYIRYVDDFVIFHDDKAYLKLCRGKIIRFLSDYRLMIHESKACARKTCYGITFLGYRVFLDYIRITNVNLVRARRRFKQNMVLLARGLISKESFACSLYAWFGHVGIVKGKC